MEQQIWEKNKEALEKVYPHILEFLEKEENEDKNSVSDETNVKSDDTNTIKAKTTEISSGVETICERTVLYMAKDGSQFLLDSLHDNTEFMDVWFQSVSKFMFKAKMFMFGLGNGMYARKIMEEAPEDVTLIVYEPSKEILIAALQNFDMEDLILNERFILLTKVKPQQKLEEYYYELLDYRDLEGMVLRNYLNYVTIFPDEFYEYHSAIQKVCNSIIATQEVIGRYGKMYYENTFANLDFFVNSKSLEGLYYTLPKDYPAIVVAAGPSLDKNILELKKAKGKAFIIAVDTALRPLLRNGIKPDIFISIDGKKVSSHFSEQETAEIPMVCYLLSHSEVLKKHTAPKFFVNDLNFHIQNFLSKKEKVLPVISSGGSVANDAFSIAQALGFETIIMVGQDLAYTDNKTHSKETVRGEKNIDTSSLKTVMVEGIDGNPVASSTEFELYRAWFEEQILKFPNIKVIDATEGGAKIHGSLIQTLAETIEQECTKEMDWEKIIAEAPPYFDEKEKQEIWSYIRRLPEDLEDCLKRTQRGIRDYDKMLELVFKDHYHNNEMRRLFADAKEAGDSLEKDPSMDYVRNRIQTITTEFIKDIYKMEDDEKKELIAACNKGRDYLKVMENELKVMLPDIRNKLAKF